MENMMTKDTPVALTLKVSEIRSLLTMIDVSENMARDYSQDDDELEEMLGELDCLRNSLDPLCEIRRVER